MECYSVIIKNEMMLFAAVWVDLEIIIIGEGNGSPLQCSFLENPRDGEAWWAAVSGVTQSRTRLKRLTISSSRDYYTK